MKRWPDCGGGLEEIGHELPFDPNEGVAVGSSRQGEWFDLAGAVGVALSRSCDVRVVRQLCNDGVKQLTGDSTK